MTEHSGVLCGLRVLLGASAPTRPRGAPPVTAAVVRRPCPPVFCPLLSPSSIHQLSLRLTSVLASSSITWP